MRKTNPLLFTHSACNARPVHTVGSKPEKLHASICFSAVHPTTDIAKILRHVRFLANTGKSLIQKVRSASNPFKRKSDPEIVAAAVELIFRPAVCPLCTSTMVFARWKSLIKVMGSVDLHQPSRTESSNRWG